MSLGTVEDSGVIFWGREDSRCEDRANLSDIPGPPLIYRVSISNRLARHYPSTGTGELVDSNTSPIRINCWRLNRL